MFRVQYADGDGIYRLLIVRSSSGGASMKVLLVDDSKFMRLANAKELTRAGYEVLTAEDGEDALRVASDGHPDLILLDMMLPKLSGPEVLKRLKANPVTASIPVVVLTSLSQKNEEKLIEAGAAAYFEKGALSLDKGSGALVTAVQQAERQFVRKKAAQAGR